ncbi:hypothetical protein FZC76_03130 [Sutcliffiella horikoshii]|uniref:Lipoprotein n=1 Tax=Sutcliffiella horikoshii TaxID=79883 RepID=A0A5D4T6G8_9BACI|nr:hypothetical protein [Sutcliffiella horikoshii]TYS70905.1 hypothetical protein FZC76_03130 [Sutcliffiella horikoshii]
MTSMKLKTMFIALVIVLLCACTNQNEKENAKGPTITEERKQPGLMSNDQLIRDSRNEVLINLDNGESNNEVNISKQEAKSSVIEYLELTRHDSTNITYEGTNGDYYLFHASDLVYFNNQPEKLSRGWYKVHRSTGEVSLWKK